jgi:predicted AAA+ superfamily ATPase
MRHEEMLSLIEAIFNKVKSIHTEGQKEYAMNENNVFANFQRIANQTNIDQKMVLWIYLMKHIDGIASYIKGHKSQRENVRGRLTDAIVYLCILWGMIAKEDSNEK